MQNIRKLKAPVKLVLNKFFENENVFRKKQSL